jgi:hypothetical protein
MTVKTKVSPRAGAVWLALLTTFACAATALTAAPVARGPLPGASQSGSLAAADRMQQKLEAIVKFGAIPRLETQSTIIEEGEVNAYLAHYLQAEIPPGISTPTLRIHGDRLLSATATLDLDALNASRPPAEGFDPVRLLRGSLAAKVSGRLVTENGTGRFELESAELGGIPLPRALVSQLVTRFSTSADQPQGIDLDAPFDLPSSIREIRVEPGQVTVLQ